MPAYRIYHLDRLSGHIQKVEEYHAADDVAAIHAIQERELSCALELWREGQKVRRFDLPPNVFESYVSRTGWRAAFRGNGPSAEPEPPPARPQISDAA